MTDALKDFVEGIAGQGVTWGVDDCSAWPCAWIEKRLGCTIDRPIANDSDDALRIIKQHGGLVELWQFIVSELLMPTYAPKSGDVGVVALSSGAIGCIFRSPDSAFIRTESGARVLTVFPRHIKAAWAVP